MATKKNGTGFKAPEKFKVHPKGSRIKHNADGTITVIEPKKKK